MEIDEILETKPDLFSVKQLKQAITTLNGQISSTNKKELIKILEQCKLSYYQNQKLGWSVVSSNLSELGFK